MTKRILGGLGLVVAGFALALAMQFEWHVLYHAEHNDTVAVRHVEISCAPRYPTQVIDLFGAEKK